MQTLVCVAAPLSGHGCSVTLAELCWSAASLYFHGNHYLPPLCHPHVVSYLYLLFLFLHTYCALCLVFPFWVFSLFMYWAFFLCPPIILHFIYLIPSAMDAHCPHAELFIIWFLDALWLPFIITILEGGPFPSISASPFTGLARRLIFQASAPPGGRSPLRP